MIEPIADQISGFMFHNNCENADFDRFDAMLTQIEDRFGPLIKRMEWISLGGGIHFTGEDYPLDRLAERLKRFSGENGVQVYLEPGEAAITNSTTLEVTVLDTLYNGKHLAIVDSSIEAHMLDLLIYRESARMEESGDHEWMVCGKSCLAGDIFGGISLPRGLEGGRPALDPGRPPGYTMVKKNWFNGVQMPAIAIRDLDRAVPGWCATSPMRISRRPCREPVTRKDYPTRTSKTGGPLS